MTNIYKDQVKDNSITASDWDLKVKSYVCWSQLKNHRLMWGQDFVLND